MNRFARNYRPNLECLENRLTPAGNVTVSVVNGTLFITGDVASNDIAINRDVFLRVAVSSGANPTTINRQNNPIGFFNVSNIKIAMGAGDDTVTFNDSATPLALTGFISLSGGAGSNTVIANDLSVGGNFSIINFGNGNAANTLTNLTVTGSMQITNNAPIGIAPPGIGDNVNTFQTTAGSTGNNIHGNLTIINGTGNDDNVLQDMNVGGSVAINNGKGDIAGNGAFTEFVNVNNTARSSIGGSLAIANQTGTINNFIADISVLGKVNIANGVGAAVTTFTNSALTVPPVFGKSVTITGTGANDISFLGGAGGLPVTIDGGLTINTPTVNQGNDITLNDLNVVGATSITLGTGADTVDIENSTFVNAFTLATGAGDDDVTIQGIAGQTIFAGFTQVGLGTGANTFTLAPAGGDVVTLLNSAVFGGGGSTPLPSHPGLVPPPLPFTVSFIGFI
jgi:hypothetical protein